MKKSALGLGVAMVLLTAGLALEAVRQRSALRAPIQGAEITGKIRDMHGRPVAALKISPTKWFGADFGSAVSDDKGAFRFQNVVPRATTSNSDRWPRIPAAKS